MDPPAEKKQRSASGKAIPKSKSSRTRANIPGPPKITTNPKRSVKGIAATQVDSDEDTVELGMGSSLENNELESSPSKLQQGRLPFNSLSPSKPDSGSGKEEKKTNPASKPTVSLVIFSCSSTLGVRSFA